MTEDNSKNDQHDQQNQTGLNHSQALATSPQGKSRGGVLLSIFAVLVSILTAIFCGYVYYTGLNQQDYVANQLSSMNNNTILDKNKFNTRLKLLNHTVSALESQVHSVAGVTNNNLVLLQLNQLLGMANQSLVVYNDNKSALKLLNYVVTMLDGNTQAQYVEVKSAVASDIARLTALQYVDAPVLLTKLNALSLQISEMPIIDYDRADKPALLLAESGQEAALTNNLATTTSLWSRFWYNLKKELRSIVVISNTDTTKALQLLPNKEIIIRDNIKLYVLNAKIGLLQHDQASWVFNLQSIKADLTTYFSKSSINTALIANLDELIKVNITLSGANIDNSIRALNKLNNLQQ